MATYYNRSSSAKYEPQPRYLHVSQCVGSKVLVQGGWTKEKCRQHFTSVVETFDPYSELWEQRPVEGDAPPGAYAAASASLHDDLFTFGGWDDRNIFNTLHRLDTKTWRWHQLSPQNAEGAPMPKAGSRMISFRDSLGVFGGLGLLRGPIDGGEKTFSNEFHIYHLKEGNYTLVPPPHTHTTVSFIYTIIRLSLWS